MPVFTVLEKLAPHIEKEVNLILNSKQEAQTLKSKLDKIHEGLQDAERHGVTDKNVNRWLGQLEDVMNEMDDTLDQWETKNVEMQMEQSELDNLVDPWEKVHTLLLSVCSSFKHVVGRRNLTKEMIALSGRLDKILEEKGRYNFVSSDRSSSSEAAKQETTSFVDKSKAHGRKDATDRLVDLLLGKGVEDTGPMVVSVVGTGGLGKTTLAQLVYNDDRVKKHFGRLKAWVSVPEPFDALPVAKAILATFDKTSVGEYTLEVLEQRIKAIASRKNFLLVLDNVGTVDRYKWESLENLFVGETGFRILVTTRNEKTAKTVDTDHLERLDFLSDSDCATILNTIALKETRGEEHKEFLKIGYEIAKKCNGLPLAAKTIGYALASRATIKEWRDILESPLWKYEDEMSDILRPLRLSYMDLSPLLKRCFLSSVLYSKGFNFDSKGLIRIWMAQHYVDLSGDPDQVDPKGYEHLKKLSERSFFQVSGRNDEGEPTYKMHDIMYDFATHLSGGEYYIIIDGRTDKRPYRLPTHGKTRYFSARFVFKKDLPANLFKLLNRARLLCLSDCEFEEFSEDLGKLIHLRYLDLSGNLMKELPENVSNLYNLQTLDLRRCRNLIRLPLGLKKMLKLRHLLISHTDNLLEFPEELRKLTGVWTLYDSTATRDSLVKSNQLGESLPKDSFTCLSLLGCVGLFHARYEAAEVQSTPHMISKTGVPSVAPEESPYMTNKIHEDGVADNQNEVDNHTINGPVTNAGRRHSHRRKAAKKKMISDYFERLDTCNYITIGNDVCEATNSEQYDKLNESWDIVAADVEKLLEDEREEEEHVITVLAAESPRRHPHVTGDLKFELPPSRMASNLRTLEIHGSRFSHLPDQLQNLPMLVTLRIQKMDFRALTLQFFVGAFPKLETLTVSECELWEEWEDLEEADEEVILPCLNYLAITLCQNLKRLPHRLLRAAFSLQELFVAGCPLIAAAYDREMEGENWDQISEIPNTIILADY